METKADVSKRQFLLRLPSELHKWFKQEAKRQRRTITSEMILALEAWKISREISELDTKRLLEEE